MKRFRSSAVACLVLVQGASAGAARRQTPEQVVRDLYGRYGEDDRPDPLGAAADRIFAPALLRLIREDQRRAGQGVGLLDEDPFCDCQDDGGFRLLRMQTRWRGPTRATVTVRMRLGHTPRTVGLDLDRSGTGWLVADLHDALMPSLLGFLRAGLER